MKNVFRMTPLEIDKELKIMQEIRDEIIDFNSEESVEDQRKLWSEISHLRHVIETSNFNAIDGSNIMRALQSKLEKYHKSKENIKKQKLKKRFDKMGGIERLQKLKIMAREEF